MESIFCGSSIDDCLKKATDKLTISKNDLKYKIIKEERKFFKNRVEIQILNNMEKIKKPNKEVEKDILIGAKVENGKIIVKESNDFPIKIKTSEGILLYLNGAQCTEIEDAKESDSISYEIKQQGEAERKISINVSENKLEAFITISATPQLIYGLKDKEFSRLLILEKKEINQEFLPKYTKSQLIQLLNEKRIKFGIIEEALEIICKKNTVENVLVARGQAAVDDEEDKLEFKFSQSHRLIDSDDEQTIDYRNVNSIINVRAGDTIAKVIKGKSGNDGIDIFGNKVKRKIAKPLIFKVGTGCKLKNDEIISEIEGRPDFKANSFCVHKVYNVKEVSLATGNIDFIGEVIIDENVDEGMEVQAGYNIFVGKNVESARLSSSGEININGNIVNSTILAGSDNVEQSKYFNNITMLDGMLVNLINSVKQIKENNILGPKKDGEIVKILIESKFKNMGSVLEDIAKYYEHGKNEESVILHEIKSKLMGAGPLNIKDVSELNEIKAVIKNEMEDTKDILDMQSDIYMSYVQGSTVEASGSIYVVGKGQFTSNMTALKNIEFTQEGSVCRGGILCAENEIKLKTVGSKAAVNTMLKVSRTGKISADIAYSNTTFCFGQRQLILDVASRNVIAYLDSDGEIKIERLLL